MVIIFWDFLISDQILISDQSVIVTDNHGTYKFSHKIPSDWILAGA